MNILYPLFAMAALTFFCMFRLGYMRFTAVRRKEVDFRFFRQYRDYDEPDDLRVMSRRRQSVRIARPFLRDNNHCLHYGDGVDSDSRSCVGVCWPSLHTQLHTPDIKYCASSFPRVRDQPGCADGLVDRCAAWSRTLRSKVEWQSLRSLSG